MSLGNKNTTTALRSIPKPVKDETLSTNKKNLKMLTTALSGASRLDRQNAAAKLAQISNIKPEALVDYGDSFVDALNRPEARTRWECLDILTQLVDYNTRLCDKAYHGAETALFDEENGALRLSAMRFLCRLGSTTENRSERVWPVIDEAIQCYHGDPEFQDMLASVIEFSAGKPSDKVKKELHARMKFDASNSKGLYSRKAKQIIKNVK